MLFYRNSDGDVLGIGNAAQCAEQADDLNLADGSWTYNGSLDVPAGRSPNEYSVIGGNLVPRPPTVKEGVSQYHERLEALTQLTFEKAVHHPEADAVFVRKILYALHRGNYIVFRSSSYTATQKLTILKNSRLGPTGYDPADPESIMDEVNLLTTTQRNALTDDHAICVVDLTQSTYPRRSLASMIATDVTPSGDSPPTVAQLDRGRWIDAL